MTNCTGGTMMGGRHRKGHKKTRKMRGGMMFGATEAIAPGAMGWGPVSGAGEYDSATGAAKPDSITGKIDSTIVGGKRRSRASRKGKSKKGGKKTKKSMRRRSRKMRGGMYPGIVGAGAVGTGFVGGIPGFPTGAQGYGAYAGYPANVPGGDPHPTGADGVKQL